LCCLQLTKLTTSLLVQYNISRRSFIFFKSSISQ